MDLKLKGLNEETPLELYHIKGREVWVKRDDLMGDGMILPPWGKVAALYELVKKYIDKSSNLRFSEHFGLLDFNKTRLEKIIISAKTNREDKDDLDTLGILNKNHTIFYIKGSGVDLNVFTENGKQPLRTLNVPSKNYLVIAVDSLAPGDKTLTVNVLPRSGRINSFVIDEQGKGLRALGGDFVNPINTPSRSLVIPAIPNQGKRPGQGAAPAHVLRLLTPGEVDASVTVELLSADGVFIPVGLNSRAVSAGVVTEFTFSPKISSSAFAVKITSTEPVVAAVESSVVSGGRRDFVWSTPAPELTEFTMAVTGLSPLVVFAGSEINVAVEVTLVNGKVSRNAIKGSDIATWRVPASARSFTITKVGEQTYAGALVSSVNGYGYFPIAPGSVLTRVEIPDSNIRILNP